MNRMQNGVKKICAALCMVLMISFYTPILAETQMGTVNTDKVFFRAKANTDCVYFAQLNKGSKVKLLDERGDFYKVSFDSKTGYIMKKFLSVSKTAQKNLTSAKETPAPTDRQMINITKISQIKTPNTTYKGNSGSDVKALQQALKLKGYYTAAINSRYDSNTVEAVKAFQKRSHLDDDGIAGKQTIKKLFGKNAANQSTSKTERLNWFKDGVNTIPKGATFRVKDVATGKFFSAVRWSGANHLDAEPARASDAKVIKEVFGGDWSWARRAILVKYDGHVYAASMNGMPHGTTVVSDNNFSGHFCIHFYKSRTHDTNRVDQTHQNAVGVAMRATW